MLRMISGAIYSGVPHKVQVLSLTCLAKPKSPILRCPSLSEEHGVHGAAGQGYQEGMGDGFKDLLLILDMIHLLHPYRILYGHDLQGVVLLRGFMARKDNTGKLS